MSTISNIALIGATGNLGPAILNALLDADFKVTVLSRANSKSSDSLPSHPNLSVKKVDFSSLEALTSALRGIDGVVSNMASHALLTQKLVVDAAIAAGVQRFLPSVFGSDLDVPGNRVPFNQPKIEVHDYIVEKIKQNPSFSYTDVTNGPFFDWCLSNNIFANLKDHSATVWDGGNQPISVTTLASVGKAVVGVFRNPSATANRNLRIADTTITQNRILEIATSIDGKEWSTTSGSTEEAYQVGVNEMKKENPDFMVVVMNQLMKIVFSAECEPDYSAKLDNDKVGLNGFSDEEVREVIAKALAGAQ